MDTSIRFRCRYCDQSLKAPQHLAGHQVRCKSHFCRQIVQVPAPVDDLGFASTPEIEPKKNATPRRSSEHEAHPKVTFLRRIPEGVWWALLVFIGFPMIGYGGYWWITSPSQSQDELFRKYLSTGNELIEMHESIKTVDEAHAAVGKLHEKADENLVLWNAVRMINTRQLKKLDLRYESEVAALRASKGELIKKYFFDKRISVLVICVDDEAKGKIDLLPNDPYLSLKVMQFGPVEHDSAGAKKSDSAVEPPITNPFMPIASANPTPTVPEPTDTRPIASTKPAPVPPEPPDTKDPNPAENPKRAADPSIEGEWKLSSLYSVYTSRQIEELLVNNDHFVTIHGNQMEVKGEIDGKPKTHKYVFDAKPAEDLKQFTQTNAANPKDVVSGIYWVDKNRLLIRMKKLSDQAANFEFSGVRLQQTNHGAGFKIPQGFTLNPDDTGPSILSLTRKNSVPSTHGEAEKTSPNEAEITPKPVTNPLPNEPIKNQNTDLKLKDMAITKTTAEPPFVEFNVKLDLGDAVLLEAWASVGIPDAGKTLNVFAGALHRGLLSANGIDFANPDPALKAQRVSMTKRAGTDNIYDCKVQYPKLNLDNPETEFTMVAAFMKNKNIVNSNAASIRVNLKTGKIIPK